MRKIVLLLWFLFPLTGLSQFDYFPPDTNTFIPFLSRSPDGWRITTTNLYNYTPDGNPYGLNWIYYFEHSWLTNTRFFGGGTNEWLVSLDDKFWFRTNGDFRASWIHVDATNADYSNVNGANAHILLNNTNHEGQTVVESIVNGSLAGKWRTDYAGFVSHVARSAHNFYCGGDYGVGTDAVDLYNDVAIIHTDLDVEGKIYALGGIDPPYLLLDTTTRVLLKNRVLSEVQTDKQSGAALFWNTATHRVETYVAAEDRFYALDGSLLSDSNSIDAGKVVIRHHQPHPVPAVTNSP